MSIDPVNQLVNALAKGPCRPAPHNISWVGRHGTPHGGDPRGSFPLGMGGPPGLDRVLPGQLPPGAMPGQPPGLDRPGLFPGAPPGGPPGLDRPGPPMGGPPGLDRAPPGQPAVPAPGMPRPGEGGPAPILPGLPGQLPLPQVPGNGNGPPVQLPVPAQATPQWHSGPAA